MATHLTLACSFRGDVVLFAVEREAKAILRLFPKIEHAASDAWFGHDDHGGQPVLIGVTGVGKARARATAESLLSGGAAPRRVVIAGFAGALRQGMPLAEVIFSAEVVDEHGGHWQTSWPEKRSGRVLTCDHMVGEPARKLALGILHEADCVEMESSAVAEICHARGIPFGCVRVISDDVTRPLSKRLMGLVESGRVSIPRLLWEIVRSPKMGAELIRLAKHTRLAADRLAARLWELLAADLVL